MITSLIKQVSHKARLIGRTLAVGWRLRPWVTIGYFLGAALEITGTIVTIYATAQLGGLLAAYISGKPTNKIWFWLVIDISATVFIGLGFWLMSFCQRLQYFSVVQWSVNHYMHKLCMIDFPDHYDREVRNQINKVESGFAWIMPNLANASLELIYGIVRFIVITVVVAQISWWIVPIIILFLLPSLIAEAQLAQIVWFAWDEKGDERHVFWTLFWVFKQARAQLEIRSQQVSDFLTEKISRMNSVFYLSQEHKFRHASKRVVASKVLEAGGVAAGSIVLIKRFLAGSINFERYLFLSGALLRVSGSLNAVFGTLTRIQEWLLYAETFYDFTDRPVTLVDQPDAIKLPRKTTPEIVIEDLSFQYPGSHQPVLEDLNLSITAGEHLAIVGENGAGKSTLIKLLLRFYLPGAGSIKINGIDLQTAAIDSWYAKVATLFQDFNHYPFSIRENIQLGDKTTSGERFNKAARLSDLDNIAKALPKRYDTILDSSFKDGIEPSGGEYQRVALARAFFRQASLLILDEPTASIDAKAEYDIFNNIFKEYRDKTAIIVSHRFSTVRRADRIVVLDKGKIIEQGSHTQLMKQKGLYHEMFSKQAEGYR